MERIIEVCADEYRELVGLAGRVKAALIFLDTDEYAPRNVLIGILRGEVIKTTEDIPHDE